MRIVRVSRHDAHGPRAALQRGLHSRRLAALRGRRRHGRRAGRRGRLAPRGPGADADRDARPGGTPRGRCAASIGEANRRIHERARADPDAAGMGTTVTAALRQRRAHRLRPRRRLARLPRARRRRCSSSRTTTRWWRSSCAPRRPDAARRPSAIRRKSIITRALGVDDEVDVDTWSSTAQEGDVVLLCSDGLSGMVGEDEMQRILQSGAGSAAGRARARGRRPTTRAATTTSPRSSSASATAPPDGARAPMASRRRATRSVRPPAPPAAAEASRHFRFDAPFLLALPARSLASLAAAARVLGRRRAALGALRRRRPTRASGGLPGRAARARGGGLRLYRQVDASPRPRRDPRARPSGRQELFDHELVSLGEAQRRVGRIAATRPWDATTRTDTGPAAS